MLLVSVEPLGQPEGVSAPLPLARGVALWEALPEKLEDLEEEVDCVAGALGEGDALVDTAAEGVPILPREGVAGVLTEASTVVLGCGDELRDGVCDAEVEAHGVALEKGELEVQPDAAAVKEGDPDSVGESVLVGLALGECEDEGEALATGEREPVAHAEGV